MTIKPGAIRFNTDSMKLEIFRGSANYEGSASMAGIGTLAAGQWEEIQATSPDIQTGGTRGIYGGGDQGGGQQNVIQYFNIDSTGDSVDFGDLTGTRTILTAAASRTRGLFAGGYYNGNTDTNVIEFITISSTGNGTNFGDLTERRRGSNGLASSTRAVFGGGLRTNPGPTAWFNVIDYVTIASTGDAKNFGDLTVARISVDMGCSSPVRGLFAGGQAPAQTNNIDFVTISTLGDAADFGDLTVGRGGTGGCANAITALWGGGYNSTSNIDKVSIATLGNAILFGDLSSGRGTAAGLASGTRGVFAAGNNSGNPGGTDIIDYVQFASQGDAIDFGDILDNRQRGPGLTNGHGGLG